MYTAGRKPVLASAKLLQNSNAGLVRKNLNEMFAFEFNRDQVKQFNMYSSSSSSKSGRSIKPIKKLMVANRGMFRLKIKSFFCVIQSHPKKKKVKSQFEYSEHVPS